MDRFFTGILGSCMDSVTNVCAVCGQAARVCILADYVAGRPAIRHLCFRCADREPHGVAPPPPLRRASTGGLMILAGTLLGLLGLAADHLGIHGNPGFGWYKQSALLSGSLLICLGCLWRIDAFGVIGALVFLLAASANLLHLAGRSGFGFKQQVAIALGSLLVVVGATLRRRSGRRAARRHSASA